MHWRRKFQLTGVKIGVRTKSPEEALLYST